MHEHPASRRTTRRAFLGIAAGSAALALTGCGSDSPAGIPAATPSPGASPTPGRPGSWSEASHGDGAAPDLALVFPADRVNTLRVTIAPETWDAMLAEMTAIYGPRGGAPVPGDLPNPGWVRATIDFDGRTWPDVGFRFKGSSSLAGAWSRGTDHFPFKLEFDRFADDTPAVAGQRFHGFRELSFANNHRDPTRFKEVAAYELLRGAGLPAGHAAIYRIELDRGDGPALVGLSAAVEVVGDTVVARAFPAGGNLYEAGGDAASFAAGETAFEDAFEPEGGDPDWSDLRATHAALHAPTRTGDPAAWRTRLDELFDTDTFLAWLGLATTMGHFDTYGGRGHNFYLYNDPASGRLTWLSWDHNLVLPEHATGYQSLPFDRAGVTAHWPLIRFLLDDPHYRARYLALLRERTARVFEADALAARFEQLAALVAPHLSAGEDAAAYHPTVERLTATTGARAAALAAFLG
ncbi:MAG: CotH kinase family protein [Dehalococcoidia bacterium]|nr:CotH kinase family protein [Dehalococcoidia bacterium]